MRFGMLVVICVVVLSGMVYGDEIVFKNGDKLTGKIDHLVGGKMILKSAVAGTVTISLSDIQTFSTDEAVETHLADGTVFKRKVVSSAPGQFKIEGDETLTGQNFSVASIASINPPPKPKDKWKGNLTGGFTSTHGNTKTDTITGSVNLNKRTEKDRTTLGADFAKAKQEDPDTGVETTTEDWWRARGKYDYFFSKKFYGYLDGRYAKDSVAELDRRVIIGLGGGYQVVESDIMNFSMEAGAASLYEKFDNQTESNSELSAQFGYRFDRKLNKKVKFIHDLTYYPSTEQVSDYFLSTTAELRANFANNMFSSFKAVFDYDTSPAIGKGSTDTKYIFGIGLNF
jgi:putative salt-induced outer membrane protein YdiY